MTSVARQRNKSSLLLIVIVTTTLIGLALVLLTRDINFWPSDSYRPYVPTAARLFELQWPSQMHTLPDVGLNRLNMHGKETLILGIAVMQKILGDTESLFPNVLLLIIAVCLSSLLLFLIFRRLFDDFTALTAYILFAGCCWPYIYILQGAHPPLVLMNFLVSFYLLVRACSSNSWQKQAVLCLGAGLFCGLMLFSSPTAAIYLPYFLFIPLCSQLSLSGLRQWTRVLPGVLAGITGLALTGLYFTLPDPFYNFQQFYTFVQTCQGGNHFGFYRSYLLNFFPLTETFRGAGWLWVIRYALLIVPVLFPAYVLSLLYILKKGIQRKVILIVALVSLSTPLAVETAQVAQFGRNYFSWLFGMIFLISFAVHLRRSQNPMPSPRPSQRLVPTALAILIALHLVFNITAFATDILPARLATTYLYRWLIKQDIDHVLVYQNHPRNLFTADMLNNPRFRQKIKFYGIKHILEPVDGYILVPPLSGKTIWNDCAMDDFQDDPWLTQLVNSGAIERYTPLKLRTLGWSRFWNQEEEVCTYRDLILKQITPEDRARNYLYILDVKKLRQERGLWQKTTIAIPSSNEITDPSAMKK